MDPLATESSYYGSMSSSTSTDPVKRAASPATIRSVNSEIRHITSHTGAGTINFVDAKNTRDPNALLAEMGYQQQLNRGFSTFQTFGITMSIMGLLSSIASTAAQGLVGGPAFFVWGWFVGGFFILHVGYSLSEMCSSLPAASGPYLWVYYYAPVKWKESLSFLCGWSNCMALVGSVCSITSGLAVQVLSIVYIAKDGGYEITDARNFGVFLAFTVLQCLASCFPTNIISKMQTVSVWSNNILVIIFLIALPVGTWKSKTASFRDASFIFTKIENTSGWSNGWTFLFSGLMPSIWTIGALDSSVHMSEEVKNPVRAVPIGLMGSIAFCWIVGFIICIVICACMSEDIDSVLNSDSGQPIAQIFYDSMGKNWTIAFMSLCAFCQFLMGCSIMVAFSRQIWAFARDDGLPFSKQLKIVDKKTKIPLYSVIFSGIVSILLGLLILIGETASNALFSISIIGGYLAWSIPSLLRMTSGRDIFRPGPFFAGKNFSRVINVSAILFQWFVIVMDMFPANPNPDKTSMNYSVVINCGVWILSMVYYFTMKKGIFTGPKSDLEDDTELLDAIEDPNLDEVLAGYDGAGSQKMHRKDS